MTNDEKAVARLKIYPFYNQPERNFYLYKGINSVGRDPNVCKVWLTEDFICRVHMHIDVQDEFIFIQDEVKRPGEKPTTFSRHVMELNTWYDCSPDKRYKLAGLLTLSEMRRLNEAEQEAAPRKDYITPEQQTAIDNRTHMEVTFVGEGPTVHNTQPSAPSIEMPDYYDLNPRSRGSSYSSRPPSAPVYEHEGDHIRAPCDDSFEPTHRIEDLTQVVREVEYDLSQSISNVSRSIFLPPAPIIPGVPADVTLPRPIVSGGPGLSNASSIPRRCGRRSSGQARRRRENQNNTSRTHGQSATSTEAWCRKL
ncbi:hypothetical protein BGX30_005708 [Mortierella sp. GBA39]|nr:hypothetical protein BGX30_005708 [Mortierella sp. GBA39]